jgi:phosphoserine phosphatase
LPEKVAEYAHDFFQEVARHKLKDITLHRLKDHAEQGHTLVLVSEVVEPLAREFQKYLAEEFHVHAMRGTELLLEKKKRWYSGAVQHLCRDHEKARVAEEFAHAHHIHMAKSYAYADSISDLELLESVGNPVAVSPEPQLRAVARARKWPILE